MQILPITAGAVACVYVDDQDHKTARKHVADVTRIMPSFV